MTLLIFSLLIEPDSGFDLAGYAQNQKSFLFFFIIIIIIIIIILLLLIFYLFWFCTGTGLLVYRLPKWNNPKRKLKSVDLSGCQILTTFTSINISYSVSNTNRWQKELNH